MRDTLRIISIAAGVFIVLAACLLSAGCVAEQPGTGQAHGESPAMLEGTSWELVSYRAENGTVMPVLNNTEVSLRFENESRITGSAGCNSYFGQYSISGNTLAVSQLGSTEMYCTEPGVMDQESRYLTVLGSVAAFTLENDQLALSDASGQEILQFAREVPPAPAPLLGTKWVLTSIAGNGDAVSSVIAGTNVNAVFGSDGKVTGSAGCNSYGGSYVLNGAGLEIDSVYSTLMYCTEPGVMEQESRYLAALGSAASYRIEGDRLTLVDAAGQELLQFVREEPPAAKPLIGTEWALNSLAHGDTVSSVIAGTNVTAVFGNDGRITGSAGCNSYSGQYTISGNTLAVSQLGSTKMHCTEPGVMEQESTFLNHLASARSFSITGDQFELFDSSGKMLLAFRAA